MKDAKSIIQLAEEIVARWKAEGKTRQQIEREFCEILGIMSVSITARDTDIHEPESYTPSSVRAPEKIKRKTVEYVAGVEDRRGNHAGMIGGPWNTLAGALEFEPTNYRPGTAFIFRFNLDGTDEKLYYWVENSWKRFKGIMT